MIKQTRGLDRYSVLRDNMSNNANELQDQMRSINCAPVDQATDENAPVPTKLNEGRVHDRYKKQEASYQT